MVVGAFVRGCEINEQLALVIRELKPVRFTRCRSLRYR
nr:triple gene block protein 4 [Banmivirus BanMMV]